MVSELWTPEGVAGHTTTPTGHNAETGGQVYNHTFRVKDPVTGKQNRFNIIVDDSTSQAHLEDMLAHSVDKWLVEVRAKEHKPAPTPEQRKEIGKILNEIRTSSLKRKGSSNNRIHYSGIK